MTMPFIQRPFDGLGADSAPSPVPALGGTPAPDYTPDQFRQQPAPAAPGASAPAIDYTPDQFRPDAALGKARSITGYGALDQTADVPAQVHLMVSAQPTKAGKLAVLQQTYPDAHWADGTMVFTNPATGKLAAYQATTASGILKGLIDAAPDAAGIAGTIGGGMAGGALAAGSGPGAVVASRVIGSGVGAMAKQGYQSLVQALTHTATLDPSTPADVKTRLAEQAAGGMLAEGTGLAAGAVVKGIPAAVQRAFDAKASGTTLTVDQLLNLPTLGSLFRAAPVSRQIMAAKDAAAQRSASEFGQKLFGLPLPAAGAANDAAQAAGGTIGETLADARNEPWQVRSSEVQSMNPNGIPVTATQAWLDAAKAQIAKARTGLADDAPPTSIERHLAPAMAKAQEVVDAAAANASASAPEGLHPDFDMFTKVRSEVGDAGFKAPTAANPATVTNEQRFHLRALRSAMDQDVEGAVNMSGPAAQGAHDALNDAVTAQGTLPSFARKVANAPTPADAMSRLTMPIKKEWVDGVNDARANMPAAQWEPIAQRQWQKIGAGPDGNFDAGTFLKNIALPQFRDPAMQSATFGGTSVAPLLPQANTLARTLQTLGVGRATNAATYPVSAAMTGGALEYALTQLGHPTAGAAIAGLTIAGPAVAERLLNNGLTLGLLNGTLKAAAKTSFSKSGPLTPAMGAMFGRWTALALAHPELRDDINAYLSSFGKAAPPQQP